MQWNDSKKFRGALLKSNLLDGKAELKFLEWRDTVAEVKLELKKFKGGDLDFIHNERDVSCLPSKACDTTK